MSTMITSECIDCGACEPECPNNAITQGEGIYVIDPLLCTECVGFHDYEACAAVCPADCCVTDPNNVETEASLIDRARSLHPETDFGETFESRFRAGETKGDTAPPAEGAKQAPAAPARPREVSAGAAAEAAIADTSEPSVQIPAPDQWEIPIPCFRCGKKYTVRTNRLIIGNVLFCPHCYQSMVIKDDLNYRVRTLVKDFHDEWERELEAFKQDREQQLKEFQEHRRRELRAFEARQTETKERFERQLALTTENYNAPGKPIKKRVLLNWRKGSPPS